MKRMLSVVVAVMALGMVMVGTPPAAAVDVGDVDGPEDFRQLAGRGFSFGTPGDPVDGFTGYPDGSTSNGYLWSGAFLDPDGDGGDPGVLLISVLPDSFDFSIPFSEKLAQIWRYDFDESDPLGGTWTKAWDAEPLGDLVPECVGLRGAVVSDIGDGLPKAFFSCVGGRGKLIYTYDGVDFFDVSSAGIPLDFLGFREIAAVDHDEDGVDDALYISPVGIAETGEDGSIVVRTDLAPEAVMLANTDPLGNGRWRRASQTGFGDPNNIGIFALAGVDTNGNGIDDAVMAVSSNRVEGAQAWVSLEGCRGGFAGFLDQIRRECGATWDEVMDKGAGRPLEIIGGALRNRNAFASDIAQVGDTIYVSLGETVSPGNDGGGGDTELASITVSGCPDAATATEVRAADCSWIVDNVMGDPRPLSAATDVSNFNCVADRDWCVPTSLRVASFGDLGTVGVSDWDALESGEPFYLWRLESDGERVWMTTAGGGTFDFPNQFGGGFQTWRIDPATDVLTLIDGDGFSAENIGGRTLVWAPPIGIVIGTGVRDTGGNVYAAGCHPGDPFPNAGGAPGRPYDQIVFDDLQDDAWTDDPAGNGEVDIVIDASSSLGAPCDDLVDLEIYTGSGCSGSPILDISAPDDDVPDDGVYVDVDVEITPPFSDFTYSILAEAESGAGTCRDHVVRASADLPPTADVDFAGSSLEGLSCNPVTGCSWVEVDVEDDDASTFTIPASCTDPESKTPLTCTWTSEFTGQDITPAPVLFNGSEELAIDPAGEIVTVTADGAAFELGDQCGALTPSPLGCTFTFALMLTAVDSQGLESVNEFLVTLQPPFVGPAVRSSGFACGGVCISKAPGETDDPTVGVPIDMVVEVVNRGNVPADFGLSVADSLGGTVTFGATTHNSPGGPFVSLTGVPGFSTPVAVPFTWTPAAPGPATLTASIPPVPGDNPTDNSGSKVFEVLDFDPAFDAAVLAVTADEPAESGVTQTVTVTVRNNGDTADSFDVALFEGDGGPQIGSTQTVTSLGAGATTDVPFDWTPGAEGTVTLTARVSNLVGGTDEVPGNDSLSNAVAVVDPASEVMHLRSLSGSLSGFFLRVASIEVEVVDGNGDPVRGAEVEFDHTRGFLPGGTGTVSCTTDATGSCEVSAFAGLGSSSVTVTVVDVTSPSALYVPADNEGGLGDPATITIS